MAASTNMRDMNLTFRPIDILNNQTTDYDLYVVVSLVEKSRPPFRTTIEKRVSTSIILGQVDTRTAILRIQVFSPRTRSLFSDKCVGQVNILVSELVSSSKDDGTHAIFDLLSPWSKKHRGNVKFSSTTYLDKRQCPAVIGCDDQFFSRWCQIEVAL